MCVTTSVMTHFASSSWEPELFWPSNVCDKKINVKQFKKMLNTKNERSQWVHDTNKKRDLYLFCQNWNLQSTIFYNECEEFSSFVVNGQWKSQECKTHSTCRQRDNRCSGSDNQLWYQCLVLVHAQTVLCADEQHNKLLLHLKRQHMLYCFKLFRNAS